MVIIHSLHFISDICRVSIYTLVTRNMKTMTSDAWRRQFAIAAAITMAFTAGLDPWH